MKPLRVAVDLSEDRPWLDGFRAGRHDAMERVFRTYLSLVHALVRAGRLRNGGAVFLDEAEQDDVIQDVFLRLFQPATRARYDGLRPYAHLVTAITRNAMVDRLRRRSTGEPLGELSDAEQRLAQWTPRDPLPDENLLSREEQSAAAELLDSLDDDERALVKARYTDGLSQRDAADALGISRQNLRTLEARLQRKMDAFAERKGLR